MPRKTGPPPLEIPVIETGRLKLRAHRLDDFADCAAMWSDPAVTRFIGGKPSSEQQSWARMLNYLGHWALMGFGYWAIEEKATKRFIGELGFADFKRDLRPSPGPLPELGWAIVPREQGKGYASEAIGAATAWGDARLSPSRTMCLIDPDNLVSIHLAKKFGYRERGRAIYKGEPTVLFIRERSASFDVNDFFAIPPRSNPYRFS